MFLSQIEGQTAETNELLDRIEEQIISLKEVYYKQLESLEVLFNLYEYIYIFIKYGELKKHFYTMCMLFIICVRKI